MSDMLGWFLILFGTAFFISGTVALLRFPDVYTRLHALTKADNLGLGLVVSGLALHSGSIWVAAKLFLIWLLVMFISPAVSHLVARSAYRSRNREDKT